MVGAKRAQNGEMVGRICAGDQFSTSCTVSQLGDGGVSIPPRSILWWMVCGGSGVLRDEF